MFKVGEKARANVPDEKTNLISAWTRLTKAHGCGPFYIVGVHPKGLGGDQLICLQTSGQHGRISRKNISMVDGRILRLA
jgi:hypothetical protein